MTTYDGVDTTGWSTAWKHRLADASPGLTVPQNTPRGRSEQRFLAHFDAPPALTFQELCGRVAEPPNAEWGSVERYVADLLRGLKKVESVRYNKRTRRWERTERGAAAADANAEWVLGPVHG